MKNKKIILKIIILTSVFILSIFSGYIFASIIYIDKNKKNIPKNTETEITYTTAEKNPTPLIIYRETVLPQAAPSPSNSPCPPIKNIEKPPPDLNAGLIKVAITDVRRYADPQSEMVSEAVMGEEVNIIEEDGEWLKVELVDQFSYPGWVKKEMVQRGKKYDNPSQKIIVTDKRAEIYQEWTTESHIILRVLMGSILETSGREEENFSAVLLPDGRSGWILKNSISIIPAEKSSIITTKENLISTAEKLRGSSYLWGGMSGNGIDCSGYVHMIYRANGVQIHRDADLQFYYDGIDVARDNLQSGDLIFFQSRGEITHVGMYLNNEQFIHSSSGKGEVSTAYLSSSYYSSHYAGAKRIIY